MCQKAKIDEIDMKILCMLVKDARTNLKVMAKECGLSTNAIHKRIKCLKAAGVITGTILYIKHEYFGFKHAMTIGINIKPGQESIIIDIIRKYTYLIHVDCSIGKYDVCAFVATKSLEQINSLKKAIRELPGVRKIAINLWTNFHLTLDNICLPTLER